MCEDKTPPAGKKKNVENMKKTLLELLPVPSETTGFMAGSCKPSL